MLAAGACTWSGATPVYAVDMRAYPGTEGGDFEGGALYVRASGDSFEVTGTLDGMEASVTGGIHVHAGTSCARAADVGGHFTCAIGGVASEDPYLATTYASDAAGHAAVKFAPAACAAGGDVAATTLVGVKGRAIVAHDAAGARVACGVIVEASCVCEEAEPDPSGEGDSDCGDHKTASDCGSGCAWNCGDSSESSIKINVMQIVIVVVILILLCCLGAAAFLFWPVVIGLLVAAGCVKAMQSTNNAAEATVAHPTKDTEMA